MAVPANVTASIAALQALTPAIAITTAVEKARLRPLKTQMLATGTYAANFADSIVTDLLASRVAAVEDLVRRELLAELQRIQAAG